MRTRRDCEPAPNGAPTLADLHVERPCLEQLANRPVVAKVVLGDAVRVHVELVESGRLDLLQVVQGGEANGDVRDVLVTDLGGYEALGPRRLWSG